MRRAAAQIERGAKGDQGGRHVADRGAIGDIAADRAGGTNLFRAKTAEQFAQIGIEACELRLGIGVGGTGTDGERLIGRSQCDQDRHDAGR